MLHCDPRGGQLFHVSPDKRIFLTLSKEAVRACGLDGSRIYGVAADGSGIILQPQERVETSAGDVTLFTRQIPRLAAAGETGRADRVMPGQIFRNGRAGRAADFPYLVLSADTLSLFGIKDSFIYGVTYDGTLKRVGPHVPILCVPATYFAAKIRYAVMP